jgi:hypothetical protein
MPIFVQWKWVKRTKSFLVIFHFYDDWSKPNLRFKGRKFYGQNSFMLACPADEKDSSRTNDFKFEKTVMTWAPSHPELGYLSEILRYANIVDGLSETEKRELRPKIEFAVHEQEKNGYMRIYEEPLKTLCERLPDALGFLGYDSIDERLREFHFCVELCPDYIDYLKETLAPYLK